MASGIGAQHAEASARPGLLARADTHANAHYSSVRMYIRGHVYVRVHTCMCTRVRVFAEVLIKAPGHALAAHMS